MGKGRDYEHTLVNEINEVTDRRVVATTVGYSGNDRYSFADILVCTPDDTFFIEVKKRSCESEKRTTVFAGSSSGDSGLDELTNLIEYTPEWAHSYVFIKFTHRKLYILSADRLLNIDNCFDSRLTSGENISLRKPSLDVWESAASSSDIDEIVAFLGLGEYVTK